MRIFEQLPTVNGVLEENANLAKKSWFGVGGSAEVLFIPADLDDLLFFLRNVPSEIPIMVLGAMSNVLVRSKGIKGVVIILSDWFKRIFVEGSILEVGGAVNCSLLSTYAMDHELGGLEFLVGLPGTVGGAIKMNAGCFGSEISDVFIECEAILTNGQIKWFGAKELGFKYRGSQIQDNLIITRVWFKGIQDVHYSIPKKTNEILSKRKSIQPTNKKSCGSTFKNPKEHKAWELIDAAGCRGMKIGGAMVSEKHCNFIINEKDATAEDIEALGELVINTVFANSGIKLEWEIVILGEK